MYVDIKSTIWERIQFDSKEEMDDVVAKLKSGELASGSDIADYLGKSSDVMIDTATEMTVSENRGLATLHVINEENDMEDVYLNGATKLK